MANKRERVAQENIYHVRVKGNLDEKWAEWFEGFVMASRDNGETLLSGAADQAALQGMLTRIHSLGLPLLLVAHSACPCSSRNCPRHGRCLECAAYHGDNGKLPFCLRPRTRWDKQCTALTGKR
jgi:hypothetical protein